MEIAEFSYCFHKPEDDCSCRKPRAGLVPTMYQGTPVDFRLSYTVGDKDCDLFLGDNLGTQSCLVLSGKGKKTQASLKGTEGDSRYLKYENLLELALTLPDLTTSASETVNLGQTTRPKEKDV